jgi:hypothetical protein
MTSAKDPMQAFGRETATHSFHLNRSKRKRYVSERGENKNRSQIEAV